MHSWKQGLNASFEDHDDGGFGEYDADDFYDGSNGNNNDENSHSAGGSNVNQLPPALAGLGINEAQLLQADRKVEKIEIR